MFRTALLGAAIVSGLALAAPASAQTIGAPNYGNGVRFSSQGWVDDGRTVNPAVTAAPVYNLDPGFVSGARSAFPAATVRTPLATGTGLAVRGNEP
jgi:hypothetical protein